MTNRTGVVIGGGRLEDLLEPRMASDGAPGAIRARYGRSPVG